MFRFPRDEALKKEWIAQVKRTRDKWQGPGPSTFVCSAHFSSDSFDLTVSLKRELGYNPQRNRKLLPTAVPTIFPRTVDPSEPPPPKKRRGAFQKREHQRVNKYFVFCFNHIRHCMKTVIFINYFKYHIDKISIHSFVKTFACPHKSQQYFRPHNNEF